MGSGSPIFVGQTRNSGNSDVAILSLNSAGHKLPVDDYDVNTLLMLLNHL